MSGNKDKSKGLNILCIDGCGVLGLSSIHLLSQVVSRLGAMEPYGFAQNPREYFDVVAGSGPGGLIACLLGRLGQTPDMAAVTYGLFLANLFNNMKTFGTDDLSAYSGTRLKESLKQLMQMSTGNENERLLKDQREINKCKTILFGALKQDGASTPTIFRSYKSEARMNPNCTIWEALYATMAHPQFFPILELSDQPLRQSSIRGQAWGGNPIAHVLAEVRNIYPDRHVSSILSIGAGHASTIQILDPSPEDCHWLLRAEAVAVMEKMATENQIMAEEIAARFPDIIGVYYRFNLDEGLHIPEEDEWEGSLEENTQAYVEREDVNGMMDEAVRAIKERKPMLRVMSIGQGVGQAPALPPPVMPPPAFSPPAFSPPAFSPPPLPPPAFSPPAFSPPVLSPPPLSPPAPPVSAFPPPASAGTIKPCPPPTVMFTGRDADISQVETCALGGMGERRVCVIHGLGGAGKTQLALKVIERNRNRWAHVIYIDASSKDAIESTLQEVAIVKRLGDTYKDAINWLQSCGEPWLVMFDNADRPSLNIESYFPNGNYGSILITTRLPDLTTHARGPDSVCHISSMGRDEALSLLLKVARTQGREITSGEMGVARTLLQDFGNLALAIVHAGTYIARSPQINLARYRELFLLQRQRILEQLQKLQIKVDDYHKAIFATGKMCYDMLEPNGDSQQTFSLVAFLHHGAISEELFQKAANNVQTYMPPLPPSQVEAAARDYMRGYLGRFLGFGGRWDAARFSRAIGELVSYSLLEFDQINLVYRVHPLVQVWARAVIPQPSDLALECATTLLSQSLVSSNPADALDSHYFRRGLVLHVNKVILQQRGSTSANHASSFAEVYGATGRWSQKEPLDMQVKQASEQTLGSDHPHTLASINNLISTYAHQGRWDEVMSMQTPMINSQRRVLGYEHPVTLKGTSNLASAYSQSGRLGEAEQLQAQVLNAYKRVFGEVHPETLNCMKDLATTFMRTGRWYDAEVLLVQATGTWNQKTGGQHPDALRAQRYLDAARSRRLIVEDVPRPVPVSRPSAEYQPNVDLSTRPMSFPQPVHRPSGGYVPYA